MHRSGFTVPIQEAGLALSLVFLLRIYVCVCIFCPRIFFFVEAAQCPLVPALVTDYKKYFLDFPKCRAPWNLLVA